MTVAAATDSQVEPAAFGSAPLAPQRGAQPAPSAPAGASGRTQPGKRWGAAATVVVALAGFLAVLALLAIQLRNNPGALGLATARPRVIVVRRVYQTTIHERIIGATGPVGGGTTVQSSSASVSSPASAPASAPVSTHAS